MIEFVIGAISVGGFCVTRHYVKFAKSWVATRTPEVPAPNPIHEFTHRTKELEIENFGYKWWQDFGTPCDCPKCTTATVHDKMLMSSKGPKGKPPESRKPKDGFYYHKVDGYLCKVPNYVPMAAKAYYDFPLDCVVFKWVNVDGHVQRLKVIPTPESVPAEFVAPDKPKPVHDLNIYDETIRRYKDSSDLEIEIKFHREQLLKQSYVPPPSIPSNAVLCNYCDIHTSRPSGICFRCSEDWHHRTLNRGRYR